MKTGTRLGLMACAIAAIGSSAWARPPAAAEPDAKQMLPAILAEGLDHSQVMRTSEYLFDHIGARLTNSPQAHVAEDWTMSKFKEWGLVNVHKEPFAFGRGWSIDHVSVQMVTPRPLDLRAIPIAWTPATPGAVTAQIVVAPIVRVRDLELYRGKLRGKIVLVSPPGDGSEPSKPAFSRLTAEEMAKLDTYPVSSHDEDIVSPRARKRFELADAIQSFLAQEGAVAYFTESYRDGGLLHGEGYFEDGRARVPGLQLGAEDYRRLARLAKTGPVTVTVDSQVRFHDEDSHGYNVVAEIAGTDPAAGYVMAGGHLDSWVAGDGAADDGAGVVSVMEAARILKAVGAHPRRTIRFILWEGEEQGLIGSRTYVEANFAKRPPLEGANPILDYVSWANRFPVTRQPGYDQLAAYFNIDNGSGKLRGVYAEGNIAAVPVLQEMIRPFASLGVTQVVAAKTGGTDHELMAAVGLPAFQFIQDPLDYETRVHHSSLDTFDHLKEADLRQASTVLAGMLLEAADTAQPMPRAPFPTKPELTKPFAYPDPDDRD